MQCSAGLGGALVGLCLTWIQTRASVLLTRRRRQRRQQPRAINTELEVASHRIPLHSTLRKVLRNNCPLAVTPTLHTHTTVPSAVRFIPGSIHPGEGGEPGPGKAKQQSKARIQRARIVVFFTDSPPLILHRSTAVHWKTRALEGS